MIVDNQFLSFSGPFIDAMKVVFETMVFTKIDAQKPRIKQDGKTTADISAILGINGICKDQEVKGMLILSWPIETYIKIANAMLSEEHTSFNNDIADVGAEIVNMIFGNAKRTLTDMGYTLDMSIPSTVGGKDHYISYPQKTTTVIIDIISAHGPFFLELCYNRHC